MKLNKSLFHFDNTYIKLPSQFYQRVSPDKVSSPSLLQLNEALAKQLGLDFEDFSEDDLSVVFSGQVLPKGAEPIALVYAGHQFGGFVPRLGDGRALLLGETLSTDGLRYDVQLKGSGPTPFSRGGDGKSAIGPVIREYLVSEAMHELGVPTTRSLAAVSTGDLVYREGPLPGGILTRVASSHIRIGSFEYFAAQGDRESLKLLFDYSVNRHYPEVKNSKHIYLDFLKKVIDAQATLIAQWMDVGFIHGVMNTDNMSISGETIDFGPCAFMDNFSFDRVFSSIDRQGRYSYQNQAPMAQWNLARLAECLLLLTGSDDPSTVDAFNNEIHAFQQLYENRWLKRIRCKLGLFTEDPNDSELIESWLQLLQSNDLDYTMSFRNLARRLEDSESTHAFEQIPNFKDFEPAWKKRLASQPYSHSDIIKKMNQHNPIYIPRNHLVEKAINGAVQGDLSVFKQMLEVVKDPFTERKGFDVYKTPPLPEERVKETFCGT